MRPAAVNSLYINILWSLPTLVPGEREYLGQGTGSWHSHPHQTLTTLSHHLPSYLVSMNTWARGPAADTLTPTRPSPRSVITRPRTWWAWIPGPGDRQLTLSPPPDLHHAQSPPALVPATPAYRGNRSTGFCMKRQVIWFRMTWQVNYVISVWHDRSRRICTYDMICQIIFTWH